jgi:dihydrofolate synthase/folylpolyglutamate synthase
MNYLETLAYIESLSPTLERPSLSRIGAFMAEQGNPQDRFPVFHVGGTNGKGSTVAILDSLLRRAGFRVGRFTGPHLLRWNERFHLNGVAIQDQNLARIATEIRHQSQEFGARHSDLGPLTWFEFLTALAFYYFAEQNIEVAVFEVGLGGRFDATNIVSNVLCSAVTNVSLDHMHILGDTVEAIAFEKGGIFKSGVPSVTAAEGSALETLVKRAQELGSALYLSTPQHELKAATNGGAAKRVTGWQEMLQAFESTSAELTLLGEHQRQNARVALSCICLASEHDAEFGVRVRDSRLQTSSVLSEALSRVYWPGRLQMLNERDHIFLDGAHNPAGAQSLSLALDQLYPGRNRCFVVSCFANKNADKMVAQLVRQGDRVFISEAATRRATVSKEELATIVRKFGAEAYVYETVPQAFTAALEQRAPNQPLIATGSFATVREVMSSLGWSAVEDGLRGRHGYEAVSSQASTQFASLTAAQPLSSTPTSLSLSGSSARSSGDETLDQNQKERRA